jgi:DNA-directed RNA polymerase subunit alpha
VKEDVITMLLNLRKTRLKLNSDEPQTLTLSIKGPATVTAKDIKVPGQVEILNPEQHIAEITGKVNLEIEMQAERGLGYVPKESIQKERVDIGTIALDAVFSPIRRVNYEVENMRVGDRTNYNRVRLFIETDGTFTAREALERSIEIMINQLKAIVGFKEEEATEQIAETMSAADAVTGSSMGEQDTEMFKTRITELSLSSRVESALDGASIRTIGGLVRKREEDLLAIEGLGQKGLQEIKRALSNFGLTLRS